MNYDIIWVVELDGLVAACGNNNEIVDAPSSDLR